MKFTLSWLKDHLDIDAGLDDIARRLTMLGLEVEGVTDPAKDLAAFVVGHVVSAEPHPNADRLRVCVVDTGGGKVQVVCGAPNARAGMKGVFAAVGTRIPGTGDVLKKGTIRGIDSDGMLCSEREMGLSNEHQGIIELADNAKVGTPFAVAMGLDDPVFDVAVTPDRADCLGVRGIARDLAASGLGVLRDDPLVPVAVAHRERIGVVLDFPADGVAACPVFAGRLIRNVRNRPSPAWLRRRLEAAGQRPISALVDVTNYITLDRARPLHVFDADHVRSAAGAVTVRFARAGEKLRALDGKDYVLTSAMTVIADDTGPLSLGGIIGGEATGCSDETRNVFLEAALFDPARTAATGRALQIDSDARHRFERGVDPASVPDGIDRATRLILDLCGGEAGEMVVAGAAPAGRPAIALRADRVGTLGGLDVPAPEQRRLLEALGFAVTPRSRGLDATPPSWRGDVEGEADLVEEILRLVSYDEIPAVSLPRLSALPKPAWSKAALGRDLVRRALASRGLVEAVTWSFMHRKDAELFGFADERLVLMNPISADLDVMRPTILAPLARAAQRNADRGRPDAALFEIGPCYADPTPQGQTTVAAGLRAGQTGPRHWAARPRAVDLFDAKADVLAALEIAGVAPDSVQIAPGAPAWYHPGRSGVVRRGPKNVLACFGELHPAVLKAMGCDGPMAAFEVFLDTLPKPRDKAGRARPLLAASPLQPVERDFAFVVDAGVAAGDLVRAAAGADKALIADVAVFDLYDGKGVPPGKKSLALAVTLQPSDHTLTDADIEAVGDRIVAAVAKATGGTLRG